jgi:hypothetical protein
MLSGQDDQCISTSRHVNSGHGAQARLQAIPFLILMIVNIYYHVYGSSSEEISCATVRSKNSILPSRSFLPVVGYDRGALSGELDSL